MNILILSGIYPTSQNLYGGIFVTRRCKVLNKYAKYDLYGLVENDNKKIAYIKKALNKNINNTCQRNIMVDNVTWNYLLYNKNLMNYILLKIVKNNQHIYKKELLNKVKFIEKSINIKKYDLIHVHWAFPEGYIVKCLSEKYSIPYVLTVHGSDIHTNPLKNEMIKKYTLESLESASQVIFVSNYLLQKAKSLGYSGENSVVINNGVDIDRFDIMDKEKIKKELNINKKNKVIGFVGNLINVKRADKFPTIFDKISKLYNNVEFLIVGEGDLKDKLIKECKNKNLNIEFVGRVSPEKVPYYINAMDALIIPSRNEGWSCVTLEANACGVPVVGSSNGGIPEAIGDCGIVVDEGENFEERFAQKVVECLYFKYDKNKLKERALDYSWDKIVQKECNVYKEILRS